MPRHPEQSPPPQSGRTGRTPHTARRIRLSLLAGCLALLPLVTACGGGADGDEKAKSDPSDIPAAPAAGVVAPARVEVIARLTGCKPRIRIDADELRQGLCHTPELDYLVTTFPQEKYQQAWLDSAAVYGGTYLVGPRWIVSAKDPEMLERFREKIGGTVQQLRGMGPTAGPGTA
ncbi:hypothetical protein [Streptomyces composti]|uniref:hypothetical protein n=1 Tax=Streptomyces composti TaxID=2720025 RepID=UPI00359CA75C